ncbi:MAG: GxxExxY protein [Bacteroidota bacterium]
MSGLILAKESYSILGACFKVYEHMGCGFLESIYQECLEIELLTQSIPLRSQAELQLHYFDHELRQRFRPDLLCYVKVIVELKAASNLVNEHRAQILNYLNITRFQLGLLVNFGHYPKLEFERFVLTSSHSSI